jgi:alpha-1,2-mannosyltransferase
LDTDFGLIMRIECSAFFLNAKAKMSPLRKPLLLLIAMCFATQTGMNLLHELTATHFGGDFASFWNAAHRVRHDDIAAIYDPDAWQNVLSSKTGSVSLSWFVYPPFMLFVLWPLGDATYNQAVLAWSLVPLAFYFVLIVLLAKRSGLGLGASSVRENCWSQALACAVLIALSLPFVGTNMFCGQTGTLVAMFFMGAAYFWPKHSVLTGICIGLLAIKPQMGLLMPFALFAAGQWRVVAVAATTILSLIVLSTIWLGAEIWTDYLRMSLLFGHFIGSGYDGIRPLVVGPYVSLQAAGMPAVFAGFFQVAISLAVVIVISKLFRRGRAVEQELGAQDGSLDLRWGLLAAGTLLATPYSLSYDTPLLVLSILPLLTRCWRDGWDGIELGWIAALPMLPFAQSLTVGSHVPFAFLTLSLWFGVLYRRFQKESAAQPVVRITVGGQAGSTALPAI